MLFRLMHQTSHEAHASISDMDFTYAGDAFVRLTCYPTNETLLLLTFFRYLLLSSFVSPCYSL